MFFGFSVWWITLIDCLILNWLSIPGITLIMIYYLLYCSWIWLANVFSGLIAVFLSDFFFFWDSLSLCRPGCSWKLLCKPGWSQNSQRSAFLGLPSSGIKGVPHQRLGFLFPLALSGFGIKFMLLASYNGCGKCLLLFLNLVIICIG